MDTFALLGGQKRGQTKKGGRRRAENLKKGRRAENPKKGSRAN